ncbi:DUF58 domain-containing protein [Paramicrobacterium fandaimingii]|uniref:DUF58 domain-containing protein n=1 Tax=Paramicrobacterium fandaimingii TaxID=2708079 RepID=UPI00142297E3|nr:DUF58 domain-containing protein [Microbacterium fandaimingii]
MSVRTIRLTARGWALVWTSFASLALGTLLERREGLFVAVFLMIVVVLCAVSVASQKAKVRVVRRVPEDGQCGESLEIVCEIHATGSLAAVSGWTDSIPSTFGPAPTGVLPPRRMMRGGRAAVRYKVVPSVRGRYDIGPFRITLSDALGVCDMSRSVGESTGILVLPLVSVLAAGDLIPPAGEGNQHDRTRPTAPRADELIARDYRPGDPLRRVHWRATARHGQLMVRQEEPQADPETLILLDVAAGHVRADALVDLAASIAVHLSNEGFRVTFAESDTTWVDAPPRDPHAILTALAVWPGGTLGAARDIALRSERRFSDRIPIFVLTSDVDRLGDLVAIAANAVPAVAFVASGSGLSRAAVPAPWVAAGLADRVDVAASWDRLQRRLVHG